MKWLKENWMIWGLLPLFVGVILAIQFLANQSQKVEVVSPRKNIECAVVSRMFHTSIDCWVVVYEDEKEMDTN